ncbi:tryptophan repressor-binding protein [Archaeoglobales archaeon]|nr:MAG: tryptophan repressor-binding protein [Archaeoglobales archaeon]
MKVLVVFHSITGHVMELAMAIAEGAKEVGAEVVVKRVEETIPEEVLNKNPKYVEVKEELKSFPIAGVDELVEYDAIIFGSPTRFGTMSEQMKKFIDQTGRLWMNKALAGKVAAVFQSNEMPHGGKESTLLSMMLPLYAHGMIVVGLPPEKELFKAGSYYGVTSTGKPNEDDLKVAKMLGRRVALIAERIKGFKG